MTAALDTITRISTTNAGSCTGSGAVRPRKPRPSTTLSSTPESTPVTRNEVCMKPGMLHYRRLTGMVSKLDRPDRRRPLLTHVLRAQLLVKPAAAAPMHPQFRPRVHHRSAGRDRTASPGAPVRPGCPGGCRAITDSGAYVTECGNAEWLQRSSAPRTVPRKAPLPRRGTDRGSPPVLRSRKVRRSAALLEASGLQARRWQLG